MSAAKLHSAPLRPGKLAQVVCFSIHAACRPLVWFFMKWVQRCGAAVPLSTSAHSQWIPSSLQNMIPSALGAKASAVFGFHSGCINSLPAATYSTGVVFMENYFGPFPKKVICLLWQKINYFWTLLIYLQERHLTNTADQEDYQHWAHNKCKTCFILCIYPRVLQFCQTWKEIFNHNIIDIICPECILLWVLFVLALQTVSHDS